MATIGNSYPSLIDAYKASSEGTVVEILKKQNPILDDAIATECNMAAIHRHMIRTGLPTATWGRLYKGVQSSKSTMQQVDDTTGFLEARSEIDTRLLKLAPDPAKQRLVDSAPFLETMNQEMATGIFYHNTETTPEKFKGLSARYNTLGGAGAGNQIVDAGGQGSDNTSIWFVTWGDHATSLLYPQGTKAGVSIMDKGEEPIKDADGGTYYAKVTTFEWHIGMFVKDWRYNARIANIDVSELLAGNVDIHSLMIDGYYKLQSTRRDSESSRIAIYMNRGVMAALDKLASGIGGTAKNSALQLTPQQLEGKMVKTWRDIPIRETDALLNTEARVV